MSFARGIGAILLGHFLSAPTLALADDPDLPAVDAVVQPHIGQDAPGLAVMVLKNGKVLHMQGYGHADLEAETDVTPDSLFDLASVSKEMTALAVMLQIEDGLYDEATPIADLLPAFADTDFAGRPVTVGDLVHHVSGLADYLAGDEALDYGDGTTNAEVVDWLADQPLDHKPGKKFEYSNSGYLVLGTMVPAVDQADSLADVLQTRVWGPLGMTSTALVTAADPERLVTGYAGDKGKFEPSFEPTVTEGDGNVFTSLRDLAAYEKALSAHALLSEDATDRLFTNGTYDNGKPIVDEDGEGYAFGWSVSTYDGQSYASHSGSWMGTATYYQRNLTSGVTVIVLSNGEDADVAGIAGDVEAAVQ